MNELNFWELMEHTKQISQNDGRKQAQLLIDELTKLTKDEIIDYYKFFRDYMGQAYSHNLWDAAYIIGCGCSDDGFKDFRAWLIGQGRTAFENALRSHLKKKEGLLLVESEATKQPIRPNRSGISVAQRDRIFK